MAERAPQSLEEPGSFEGRAIEPPWLDLRELPLPLCDGEAAYGAPNVAVASQFVAGSGGILVATPVYNYDVNAAIKNFVELTGSQWENKVVGFLCAAGGGSSYMAPMAFANSLMLDFRCFVVPRFVYAHGASFDKDRLSDPELERRVDELARELVRVAVRLAS